uniref:Zinc transporter foi n=1 Tax=Anopheles atroparvus TaxID=41427 RepID=A0AAG5D8G4_ANOAO
MARHIMAVCVVCLLCADHVPCKQHFGDANSVAEAGGPHRGTGGGKVRDQLLTDHQHQLAAAYDSAPAYHRREEDHRIVKRHHHHHDHDEEEHGGGPNEVQETEFDRLLKAKVERFVKKIFAEFGNPETMTMGVQGFESMMRQLDMYRLVSDIGATDASGKSRAGSSTSLNLISENKDQQEQEQANSFKCINSSDFLRRITPPRIRSQDWEDEMAAKSDKLNYRVAEDGSNSNISTGSSISSGGSRDSNSTLIADSADRRVLNNSSESSDGSSASINGSISADRFAFEMRIPQQEELVNSSASSNSSVSNSSSSGGGGGGGGSGVPKQVTLVESTIMFGERDLYNVCPLLLAQLLSNVPLERAGCIGEDSIPPLQVSSLHHDHHHHHHHEGDSSDAAVWIYSSIAILGVSLCGLLGVVVIPCMDKHFYHHALQFLVALAVGTLCGDALLHLLPHAMMGSIRSGGANAHDAMMYKGLAAVLGIVFFYFMERFLTVIAEWYKNREKKDKPSSRVRVMRDPESTSLHASSAGEKQCKHKYSSYPYCYDEIAMDTKDDHHEHNRTNENHNSALAKCANNHHTGGEHATRTTTTTTTTTVDHPVNEYTGLNHNHHHHHSGEEVTNADNNTVSTNLDDGSIESEQVNNHVAHGKADAGGGKVRQENYTIILREHETKHHGHSHTHGHVHSPPGSLSAVAWMVIMGDGLHNFTDGMTIGAAFANNIAGGFSTAIAVFCHELPHELGDFAVLLKAGMSAKEAVYYNLLSSLLSLLGMVVGIIVGHQPEASSWIFALAAGMFLYIAMVDMIPELTSSHGAEERCKTSEFVLQFLGLTLGFSIMMVIAMYEHDLMELFVD